MAHNAVVTLYVRSPFHGLATTWKPLNFEQLGHLNKRPAERKINTLLNADDEEKANAAPPLSESPVSRVGDLWFLGRHRILCGDATSAETVARLLGERKPRLMVTDPPYGIEVDSEWRDRAGLNGCAVAETRADWSDGFASIAERHSLAKPRFRINRLGTGNPAEPHQDQLDVRP